MDISKMGPEAAATAVAKHLNKYFGSKEAEAISPEESARRGFGKAWSVCFESGPFEWAVKASLEYDCDTGRNGPCYGIKGVVSSDRFIAEPYNSFVLGFYPLQGVTR